MRVIKQSLAAVIAAVMLLTLVGAASANDLSVSSQAMRATWTRAELTGGFGTVGCALTLEGSMHTRTTTKTAGALIGFITRASVGPCAVGSATVLMATLPWHVQYSSFAGILPEILSIRANIISSKWLIREPAFGVTCLFTSTASSPNTATFNLAAGGGVTSVELGGTIPCTGELVNFNGKASGRSNTNSAMTITLI